MIVDTSKSGEFKRSFLSGVRHPLDIPGIFPRASLDALLPLISTEDLEIAETHEDPAGSLITAVLLNLSRSAVNMGVFNKEGFRKFLGSLEFGEKTLAAVLDFSVEQGVLERIEGADRVWYLINGEVCNHLVELSSVVNEG